MIERVHLTADDAAELSRLQREYDQLTKRAAAALALAGVNSPEFSAAEKAVGQTQRKIENMIDKRGHPWT